MELLQLAPETLHYHCPYNNSHSMPQKRLIKHLSKCPDKPLNYKTCTYNVSHVMPDKDIEAHEIHCPNRILIDTIIYESEDLIRPVPVLAADCPDIDYDESWDGLEHSNDVLKNINKQTIVMKAKHGSTKSERKIYRTSLHVQNIKKVDNTKHQNSKHSTKPTQTKVKEDVKQPDNGKKLFIGKRPKA